MKILIATDAWEPQINGVVTTLLKIKELSENVCFITPDDFKTYHNPFYPEIRIALPSVKIIEKEALAEPKDTFEELYQKLSERLQVNLNEIDKDMPGMV